MKASSWRAALALAAGTVTLAALAAPTASAAPAGEPVVNTVADSSAEAKAIAAKWTPAAMRSAVPMDTLVAGKARAAAATKDVARGKPQVVKPTAAGSVTPMANPHGGGPWTGGGAVTKNVGRVFFTYQGRKASCSGTAVTSTNKSTVLTAGHCVKLDGAFHTDWVFVPGYNAGNAPYGTWAAKTTLATPQWVAGEDLSYDVGAAVVNPLNGQSLTDVVGAQGVAFNQSGGQTMYAFGYPAAAPYDGTKLIYCSGATLPALLTSGYGLVCDMTGGSSGGPWFTQFSESTGSGIQASVNSYKINLLSFLIFGPTFGADAQHLYNTAQAG